MKWGGGLFDIDSDDKLEIKKKEWSYSTIIIVNCDEERETENREDDVFICCTLHNS